MLSVMQLYGAPNSKDTGSLVWRLHRWHIALRLLWALNHDDQPLAELRASEFLRDLNNIEA